MGDGALTLSRERDSGRSSPCSRRDSRLSEQNGLVLCFAVELIRGTLGPIAVARNARLIVGGLGVRFPDSGRRRGRCELSVDGHGSLLPVAPTAELFNESWASRTPTELGSCLVGMGALIE